MTKKILNETILVGVLVTLLFLFTSESVYAQPSMKFPWDKGIRVRYTGGPHGFWKNQYDQALGPDVQYSESFLGGFWEVVKFIS